MEEVWKPVAGYSYYEVSNLGKVRSKNKYVRCRKQGDAAYLKKGRILKPVLLTQGYYAVSLVSDDGKVKKLCKVHRLVAEAFIPNPNNLPLINHKDEVRTNNICSNLEWCTSKYNSNYSDTGKKSGLKMLNRNDTSKCVCQYSMDGVFIAEYPSIEEAHRATGILHKDISNCCRGYYLYYGKIINCNHAGGYKWRYKRNLAVSH